MTKESIYFFID